MFEFDNIFVFIFSNILISVIIAVPLGIFHEYLHVWEAKRLGCKIVKFDIRHNEVEVENDDPVKADKIKKAPYKIILPIAIGILGIGVYFFQLGIIMGAGATILIHSATYWVEGK